MATSRSPLRLHLKPLAIAAVIAVTALPIELLDYRVPLHFEFDPLDFMANVGLFVPIGLAFAASPVWTITTSIAASVLIETVQQWYVSRHAAPWDVLANTLGTLCGIALAYGAQNTVRHRRPDVVLGRRAAWVAGGGAALLLLLSHLPRQPADFSNWEKGFGLLIGNETTDDRPWRGAITELTLTPALLPPDRWHIATTNALTVRDVYSNGEGVAPWSSEEVRRFAERARKAGRLTVFARLRTASAEQSGPARIVTFSRGPWLRNFTLGQEGTEAVFRLRTPVSAPHGPEPEAVTLPLLDADSEVEIAATYDGEVSRIYVNGGLAAYVDLAAAGCTISAVCGTERGLAAVALGALTAIAALLWLPSRSAQGQWLTALTAAMLAAAAVEVSPAGGSPMNLAAWRPLLTLGGAATICLSALPISMNAAPAQPAPSQPLHDAGAAEHQQQR